jgi:peptidoglycan/LPS O-acetylase OafA/YrhL
VSRHLAGLDGVRGLAILLVMAVHFVGDAPASTAAQRLLVKAAGYGVLGVDLFFVLSGFLITGLLLDAKGDRHYFRNFYARRTLRIFPLYYGVLAALFLVLPLVVTPSALFEVARSGQVWLWTYTANIRIALTGSWSALTYMSHFWSLAIEEHFYLLWPLAVFLLPRPALERLCLGVLVGALLLRIGLVLHGVNEISVSVLTPCRLDTLVAGGLLASLIRHERLGPRLLEVSGRAALLLGAGVVALSAYCAIARVGLPVLHQVRSSGYALFFGALTLVALKPPTHLVARLFQTRFLGYFGQYSYGLYVYHGLIAWLLVDLDAYAWLELRSGSHVAAIAARGAAGFVASLAIAVCSYHLFEVRFLALKRHFQLPPAPADQPALAAQEGPSTAPMTRPRPTSSMVR